MKWENPKSPHGMKQNFTLRYYNDIIVYHSVKVFLVSLEKVEIISMGIQ